VKRLPETYSVAVDTAITNPSPHIGTSVRRYVAYHHEGMEPGTHLGLPSPSLAAVFPSAGRNRGRILGVMSTTTTTRTAVWPSLRYRDANAAIAFLVKAFGFEEVALSYRPVSAPSTSWSPIPTRSMSER
jgi:hypothetical protein